MTTPDLLNQPNAGAPTKTQPFGRALPIGAELTPAGVSFRVWGPRCKKIEVIFEPPSAAENLLLTNEGNGYFSGTASAAKAGSLYRFRLDDEQQLYPDPISRFQPQGVHGPSQILDPSNFKWTDQQWKGISSTGQVLYELHIGTFTPEGTWSAAADRLSDLKEIGITCIEVMPVAEFQGKFGWGYDGVDLFAPSRAYGTPDDFRNLINRAHSMGLAVILDVVYNHLGPAGNYLPRFSNHFFTKKHKTDWGESINFDDVGSPGVREYYISNARHWIAEYHLDGFRFDATQAILDESENHILAEICRAARQAAGHRQIYLITENEPQNTRIVRSPESGGYGFDALWNDDFHHSAMVALTGRNEAYLTDYHGKPQEFISSAKYGYLYQGQLYRWQKQRRGTSALDLPPTCFVNYIQNHDQVANYGHGKRAHQLASLAQYKAVTAYLLLAPQTPLLFQGQEFAASSTFHYFADHDKELNEAIHKGRSKELGQFPSVAQPDVQAVLPSPSSEETFNRCKLNWDERSRGLHGQMLLMHKVLLELRRTDPALILSQFSEAPAEAPDIRPRLWRPVDGAVLGNDAFALRFFDSQNGDRLLIVNLGIDLHMNIVPEPLLAPPQDMRWEAIFATEEARFGGSGSPPLETRGESWRLPGENWRIPAHSATLLKPAPIPADENQKFQSGDAADK